MSHPMEGFGKGSLPVFEYEILVKPTRQSFRVMISQDHKLTHYHKCLFTMEGIMRWAKQVIQEDAEAHGSPHWEATLKLVSL